MFYRRFGDPRSLITISAADRRKFSQESGWISTRFKSHETGGGEKQKKHTQSRNESSNRWPIARERPVDIETTRRQRLVNSSGTSTGPKYYAKSGSHREGGVERGAPNRNSNLQGSKSHRIHAVDFRSRSLSILQTGLYEIVNGGPRLVWRLGGGNTRERRGSLFFFFSLEEFRFAGF